MNSDLVGTYSLVSISGDPLPAPSYGILEKRLELRSDGAFNEIRVVPNVDGEAVEVEITGVWSSANGRVLLLTHQPGHEYEHELAVESSGHELVTIRGSEGPGFSILLIHRFRRVS